MYLTRAVKCKCGKVHALTNFDERHDGKIVTCEQCGAIFEVAVQTQVHLMDERGKFLRNVE